jgi:hypothetical protein
MSQWDWTCSLQHAAHVCSERALPKHALPLLLYQQVLGGNSYVKLGMHTCHRSFRHVPCGRAARVPSIPTLPKHALLLLPCQQVLGGNGYVNDYPTGRILRDAKLYEIGAGGCHKLQPDASLLQ